MKSQEHLDIFQRRSRNRRNLAFALAFFVLTSLLLSGLCLYLIYRITHLNSNFWLLSSIFWLFFMIFSILRFALSGRTASRGIMALPPWKTDRRLENALAAAKLASGFQERVRLFEIDNKDINAFSLALPDGSYALFATRGAAEKLPERERVAIMAHEIAHMQAGDSLIYTILIRLAGRRALKIMVGGLGDGVPDPIRMTLAFSAISGIAWFAFTFLILFVNDRGPTVTTNFSRVAFWPATILLFLVLISVFPVFLSKLLHLTLDREREYYADMEAVYLTRDPGAVYSALKYAADDVLDVLLLPKCYDDLLFHPVVNYTSYQPHRTQPTMAERMNRIKEAFPEAEE
jgi:Zn-dependent protease with chaperone function